MPLEAGHVTTPTPQKSILPFPLPFSLDQMVGFATPAIAVIAATGATWLFSHFPGLHVLGQPASAERIISEAVVWAITAAGTYLIQHKIISARMAAKQAEVQLAAIELERAKLTEPTASSPLHRRGH